MSAAIEPQLLVSALRDRQVVVSPMSLDQLRSAITNPAQAAGLVLEPGLVELLLRDVRAGYASDSDTAVETIGILPLLSYVLLASWQQREGHRLTMIRYQHGGGIWQAVAQSAERIYQDLDEQGKEAARRILLAMIHLGESGEATRRRVQLASLMHDQSAERATTITEYWSRSRTLTHD